MKRFAFAAAALSAVLFAAGPTIADTHVAPLRETYSRIPGSEKPMLRVADEYTCIENACKALIDQCKRTQNKNDCNAASTCRSEKHETGECDY